MKICSKCSEEKPATTDYFARKSSAKDGLRSYCKLCGSAYTKQWKSLNPGHQEQYQKENAEQLAIQKKDYRQRNKESIAAYNAQWVKLNPDYHHKWDENNRESRRTSVNKYHTTRRANDVGFRISSNISRSIRYSLSPANVKKGNRRWESLVGYDRHELKSHIERQFEPSMDWSNWGEWHIDHITPIIDFNIKEAGDSEFMACWSLGNLRPLWAEENVRKSGNKTFLI